MDPCALVSYSIFRAVLLRVRNKFLDCLGACGDDYSHYDSLVMLFIDNAIVFLCSSSAAASAGSQRQ